MTERPQKCAYCRKEKPLSEMKVCMDAGLHRYVCDSKCMTNFYTPPKPRSVSDYTAEELVSRAVRNARPHECGESPRWVAIQDTFALGSTYSIQLCRIHGLDPDEKVKRTPLHFLQPVNVHPPHPRKEPMRKIYLLGSDRKIDRVGLFHGWSTDYEELRDGVGLFPVAIVELEHNGEIVTHPASYVQFAEPYSHLRA